MRESLKTSFPTIRGPASWSSPPRLRQFQRSLQNVKMTIFCGLITILVLRGTIGAGNLGSAAKDSRDTKDRLHHVPRKKPTWVMAKLKAGISGKELENSETEDADDDAREIDLSKPYSLGLKISDWDQQRKRWLEKNDAVATNIHGKPRILLVTGSPPTACETSLGDHYLVKSIKNKVDYCRIHGIEIFYNMAHFDEEMEEFWAKLPLLRRLMLSHPEVEWFWWMDSDAMFTDMVFEVPIDRYKDYNLVVHGWDELVYQKRSWIGLNAGSFLIRNCQWSLDILDAWATMGPKGKVRAEAGKILSESLAGRPDFEADDQSALVYLLSTQKDEWGDKVFLENSYALHGYWMVLVERYEEIREKHHPGLGDDRWPFVTHFVGCKSCGRYGDYPMEQCLRQMERAFNFADDQILHSYGLQHQSLSSPNVKQTVEEKDHMS